MKDKNFKMCFDEAFEETLRLLSGYSGPCTKLQYEIISKTQSNSYENLNSDNNSAHVNSPSFRMNIQEMNVYNTNEIQNICAIESALTL